ncbi:ScbA/BarX family gamma-butyrolactone biosynthesis protein [Streptomyces sp. NPDC091280]|uniref:ScbA/BarX family gamma-butyrolactone biosynthesis protein n=1 Tax=Streptomyces sp. NPDC091280 TaxID=3365984 RepID=UPI00381A99DE
MKESTESPPFGGATVPTLSWERSVPRNLVHRKSVAEVLLTDGHALGEDRYLLAAQWSRSHTTFRPGSGDRHDPLLIAETLRQSCLYVTQRFLGVPRRSKAVIKTIGFRLDPATEPVVGYGATDVTCRARVYDVRRTKGLAWPVALSLSLELSAGETEFGSAEGRARILTEDEYARLRGTRADALPPPGEDIHRLPPTAVSASAPGGVMLARDGTGSLRVTPADLRHPLFFDHPSDHIPGMALLEAARQAVCLTSGNPSARLTACRMTASRFTDWDPPAYVTCEPAGEGWGFRVTQGGGVTAEGGLWWEPASNA